MPEFAYVDLLPTGPDDTDYRQLTSDHVEVRRLGGTEFLHVAPDGLRLLAFTAIRDVEFFLRPSHLAQLAAITEDPEASANDRFVALELLRNANVAAGGVLPMCQDTGTAIISGERGTRLLTTGRDEEHLSHGVFDAYQELNLRYSQLAPLSMWDERNTGTNLPAQIEIHADTRPEHALHYDFLIMAKGGGSANKSYLFQETKATLNPRSLRDFLEEKLRGLGTAACPPYHLAVVIGGTSAEFTLRTAKYASAHYLDNLPPHGSATGHGFRDRELEAEILQQTREFGIGAQFGGKYFCHDVRVVRLSRHGASVPIAIAVSCSADRQARAKITPEGIFLEKLEHDPARFLPTAAAQPTTDERSVTRVDLDQPMDAIRSALSQLPVRARVSLTGTMIVARDLAHARIKEMLDRGEPMPAYMRDHPVYYAGPAKKPPGLPSGSFGPTTAGRMDSYVDQFQRAGGSLVMVAKGNRSDVVTRACHANGGFYLGSIGGPAARLAAECIESVEVADFPELGMEAVWRIRVRDFPAFVVVDDKGHDFFADVLKPHFHQIAVGPPEETT